MHHKKCWKGHNTKTSKQPCVSAVLFLTPSRWQWVAPKSLHPRPQCACSLHLLSILTSRDLKAWIKMLNVSGRWSLVTGWVIWQNYAETSGADPSRRRPRSLVSARERHGTEEIYFGHRARAPELRSRVRNSMDHGQRWASCIKTSRCST